MPTPRLPRKLHLITYWVVIGFSFLGWTPFATAGLIDDCPWTITSEDGQFLLVMLNDDEEMCAFEKHELLLLEKYPESGVYRNDGSHQLLWKIPYQSHCYDIFFSTDGQHVVFSCDWTDHTTSNIMIGAHVFFFHQHTEHQICREHLITPGWMVKRLVDRLLDRQYIQWEKVTFDAANNAYTIQTSQHEEFVFDIRTGKKIRTTSLWNKCLGFFLVFIPLLVIASRRITSKQPSTKKWQFSMGGLLLLMTTTSALLALSTVSIKLAGVAIGIAVPGGAIAYFIARRRQVWFTGGLLAVYGLVLGILLFNFLFDPYLPSPWIRRYDTGLVALGLCSLLGCLVGAIFAGRLEKQTVAS